MKKMDVYMCGSSTGSFSPDWVQHQRRGRNNGGADRGGQGRCSQGGDGKKRRQPRQQRLQRKPRIQLQRKLRQRQANTM